VNGWAFARVGDGYVASMPPAACRSVTAASMPGASCNASAREHTWLVECGRKADWGSSGEMVVCHGDQEYELWFNQ
jgi:hypothetical protein